MNTLKKAIQQNTRRKYKRGVGERQTQEDCNKSKKKKKKYIYIYCMYVCVSGTTGEHN